MELGQRRKGIETVLVLRLDRPSYPHLDGYPACFSSGVNERLSVPVGSPSIKRAWSPGPNLWGTQKTTYGIRPVPARKTREQGHESGLNGASRSLGFPNPDRAGPRRYEGKNKSVWKGQLHPSSCVTSSNSLNLSEPRCPFCQVEIMISTSR